MSNAIFPSFPGVDWPAKRKVRWSNKTQTSVSGKETRLTYWSYPVWDYSISFSFLKSELGSSELQQLFGFYNARRGTYDDWLFSDVNDRLATAAVFGVGDGSKTTFQLARSYGGHIEPVRAVQAITQVRVGGSPTTAYSISSTTGVITFSSPPTIGAQLDWTGSFYWRCRFTDDNLESSMFFKGYSEVQALKFRTLK